MQIYLMRHGQVNKPEGNALFGRTDVAISAPGWRQMLDNSGLLHDVQQVVSSPLVRCAKFARFYGQQQNIDCQIESDLQECDFGSWDGVPFAQLHTQWPQLEAFWQQPAVVSPPDGESLQSMQRRVMACWKVLLDHYRGKNLLLVSHGGVIRMLLAGILNLDWRNPALYSQLQIPYASITKLQLGTHAQALPQVLYVGLTRELLSSHV